MPVQERALQTRDTLIRAAASVFDEFGYSGASITEIINRARVTRGALYFHFASKEDLANGVIDAQAEQVRVAPRELRLQELVDLTVTVARDLSADVVLRAGIRLAVEQGAFMSVRESPYMTWIDMCRRMLEEARGSHELLPHIVPADTAELVVGSFSGIQLLAQARSGRGDLRERVSIFWNHMLPGIAVPGILARLDTSAVLPDETGSGPATN
ncbi:transcriptional regulator, TetR family [Actinopolyspora xinjiangensis]|uniref:Transcriptional regulator, TetR family n=1 Tax=Actinopolyspora xinjiangensis TaxID=405564 RepID=A0A1H0V9Q5_9ACTN|nr:ScbR family autoregulator-binding transcription factor [Actinopolyspora xinjiangensis]SDP75084.1 transcriptional regulator, TetR family [Actinopolyspora xinjiangensis]